MPNGIYLYLYQIAWTEVEFIPFESREDHVGRKYLSIGVFVPRHPALNLMAQLGLRVSQFAGGTDGDDGTSAIRLIA
jgi:hypothetical protein